MPTATRADRFTQTQKTPVFYSDFLNSFSVHPLTNVLAMTTNQASVRQAIKNLVLTNLGDRPFENQIGTNTRASMFEQDDLLTTDSLESNISYAIKNFEPRANLLGVQVTPNTDGNSLQIDIVFSLINNPTPVALQLVLQRVR
jgi:phage baseplate assembly protein W